MILDCCFAAKAFAREHVGKRKFELLTSSTHDARSPAPYLGHSFTRTLHDALDHLITENPKGFCTSHLYREVYHAMPIKTPAGKPIPKPLLFDQARHSYGRIWLRPQVITERPPKAQEEGTYLNLTFRLNKSPDLAVMNELALHLQFLPHIDQIRYEGLRAPREQITDFMRFVFLASKLKPIVRRLHLRRQGRKTHHILKHSEQDTPASLVELHLGGQNHQSTCDWSSAERDHSHTPVRNGGTRIESGDRPPTLDNNAVSSRQVDGESSTGHSTDSTVPQTLVASVINHDEDVSDRPAQNGSLGTEYDGRCAVINTLTLIQIMQQIRLWMMAVKPPEKAPLSGGGLDLLIETALLRSLQDSIPDPAKI